MTDLQITPEPPDSPLADALLDRYFEELAARFPGVPVSLTRIASRRRSPSGRRHTACSWWRGATGRPSVAARCARLTPTTRRSSACGSTRRCAGSGSAAACSARWRRRRGTRLSHRSARHRRVPDRGASPRTGLPATSTSRPTTTTPTPRTGSRSICADRTTTRLKAAPRSASTRPVPSSVARRTATSVGRRSPVSADDARCPPREATPALRGARASRARCYRVISPPSLEPGLRAWFSPAPTR